MPKRKLAADAVDVATTFVQAMKTALEAGRNPQKAPAMQKYLRNQFIHLGLMSPVRALLQAPVLKKYPLSSEEDVLSAARGLWALPEREFQYCAIDLCVKNQKLMTPKAFPVFTMMIETKSWWDTVDGTASSCIGGLVRRNPSLHKDMDKWATDKCMWKRRTSLIYQLKYKDETDLTRLTKNILTVFDEDEFFIQKAIGWSLRELSKTNREFVREFLKLHSKKMSTVALREAKKYV